MAFGLTLLYVVLTFLSIMDSFPELAEYRIQLIVGILAMIATLPALLITREVRPGRQAALMAAFTACVLGSWLPHGWLGGTIVALNGFMQLGIVFFLTAFNVRTVRHLKILRLCLLAVTLYLLGNGLHDYFRSPDNSLFVLAWPGEDGMTYRLQGMGILGDPNAFAQFLLAMVPLVFVGGTNAGWLKRIFVLLPLSSLLLLGIWCTHSRGALVGLVVLVGILFRKRLSFLGGGLAAAAVAVLMLYSGYTAGRSGDNRLDIWSDGLGMFKSSPIWGVGFKGFTQTSEQTAHNSFLLCAAELGMIGCFLWMGLLLVSLWQLRRVANAPATEESDPELRVWANAVLFSLTAFLIPGFFLSETYAPMLYMLLGLAAAIARMEVERTGMELLPVGNHWAQKTMMACVASMTLVYIMVRLRAF
ncbi:MAG TPA: O-antigen ligase family protein [Bryobacteraceae bacterium]|nr:O-antigen ligase family protein [Bryobacteraceae bacterium]